MNGTVPQSPSNEPQVVTDPSVNQTTDLNQTPNIIPGSTPTPLSGEPENFKTKLKTIFSIVIAVILIFLVAGIGFSSYLLAYDKITLTKYPQIQSTVTAIVMSIPFTPKTPRYVLYRAALAQSKVTSDNFDASIALNSQSFSSIPGLTNKIDVEAKGYVDYSDPKNLVFNLNADLTKDINVDLAKSGNVYYLRLNKVEGTILAFLQSFNIQSYLNQWYFLDTSTLQTDARSNLDNNTTQDSVSKQYSDKALTFFNQVLNKVIVTNDKLNGQETYKLNLVADADAIDKIPEILNNGQTSVCTYPPCPKISDYLKNVIVTIWISKDSYNILKVDTSFKYSYPQTSSLANPLYSSNYDLAVSVSFSDFNKKQEFQVPTDAKNINEIIQSANQAYEASISAQLAH